ncbi:hypothetical protein F5Y03DRAFT_380652 [Xylaria venustula]|nr:hypothetical protein F5Y03DRAFT_380652 [Xylaria venustula]
MSHRGYIPTMALDSFHHFTSLPFELRRMIYLFASPPRFVYVKEETEDWEDFEERFRTTVVQIKLHPSIAYFARNWRHRIPFPPASWRWHDGRYQTTLERYGLKGCYSKHQPWKPTIEVPDIPYHFLSENPKVAWELMRTGSFYSNAPIPAMLHMWSESRQVLVEYGYELAFRTRTCGPRTWFNFKTDVLYIGHCVSESREERSPVTLLSGNKSWDIGQFAPQDLRRVKRLALESSAKVVCSENPGGAHGISNLLQLFTGVEELYLEEYGTQDIHYKWERYDVPADKSQSLWCHTPLLEVDALSTVIGHSTVLTSTGYNNADLKAYKDENMGDGSRFFVDAARNFEASLVVRRDELSSFGTSSQWEIPKVSLVHIIPEWMCRFLFTWRWDIWGKYCAFREKDSLLKAKEEARLSIDVPRRPIYESNHIDNSRRSSFSEEFQDDIEVYEEELAYERQIYYEPYEDLSRNWITTATIAAPAME